MNHGGIYGHGGIEEVLDPAAERGLIVLEDLCERWCSDPSVNAEGVSSSPNTAAPRPQAQKAMN